MKHRTAVVAALSVVGVLVAGATALAANLGILETSPGVGELSAVSDKVTPGEADIPTPATTPAGNLVAYQVNDVGVVTLSRDGDRLSLESAAVGAWRYEVIREGDRIEMAFSQGDRQVHLEARVEEGLPVVEVWEDFVIARSGPSDGSAAPATATGSGDDEADTEDAGEDRDDPRDDESDDDSDSHSDGHDDDD